MSAAEQRALVLAQARELQLALWALAALPEFGEGSCPAFALDALDEVIAYLTPSPPDEDADPDDAKGRPFTRLRLVGRP